MDGPRCGAGAAAVRAAGVARRGEDKPRCTPGTAGPAGPGTRETRPGRRHVAVAR